MGHAAFRGDDRHALDSARDVCRAGLLFLSYSLFTIASTNLVGIQHLCQNVGTDNVICSNVPQMLLGWQALGQTGALWMLLATLLTGVMTFNGGFATASRFMYAAAREATLPPFFATPELCARHPLGGGG